MTQYFLKSSPEHRDHEWAVILAGGDGTRLKSLTRKIAGDERPKQFCSVLGGATLLEETQRRAALAFADERTLYVVNQLHEPYYAPILGEAEIHDNLVTNRAIAAPRPPFSTASCASRRAIQAAVAFFPSDHFISDNSKFMAHVRAASTPTA
jgi:mannose-1-phosphate guanylyltransferase